VVQATAKVYTTLIQAPVLTRACVQLKRVQAKFLLVDGESMVRKSRSLMRRGAIHSQSRPTKPFVSRRSKDAAKNIPNRI
jgi:hypothetical protein